MRKHFSLTSDRFYKLDSSKVKRAYPTGASYEGSYKARKRSERGLFRWLNGACYTGEFVENKRHGEGKQEWPDGSSYVGQFQHDVREGYGRHTWFNGEIYEGTFVRDKRHGKGIYQWADGTRYVGHFYNDLKEGYGCFHFPDGKRFEGIYKNNERNGAGIMTYCDGRQDVGIWLGEKLIRLCTVMENTFMFEHFSDYFVNAGENMPSKIIRANSALADVRTINEVKERNKSPEDVYDKGNDSILSVDQQIPGTFPFADILDGVRNSSLGAKGPCELASEELLHISSKGDCIRVIELLEQGFVLVDVADKTGYTALLAASVNCHKDIINCLLDYGADVNKLNYEGLSALAACHVLFYTKHTWKENIGETLASDNLFNSVHWNSQSGTFAQRKPVYCLSKTRSKINLSEKSPQSSVDTINGIYRNSLISAVPEKVNKNSKSDNGSVYSSLLDAVAVALETDENVKNMTRTDREIVSKEQADGLSMEYKDKDQKNSTDSSNKGGEDYIPADSRGLLSKFVEMERKVDNAGESKMNQNEMNTGCVDTINSLSHEHIPYKNQDAASTDGGNYSSTANHAFDFKLGLGETASLERNVGHNEVKVSNKSCGVKQSIVQRSEMVDKKNFIRVFLKRAASARSNQSSCIPFQSIESSVEGSYLDNMDDILDNQQDGNSVSLSAEEDKEGCKKRQDNYPVVTVTAPGIQESVQYSIQNAISSSLQTTNSVDDTGSLDSAEQNKQKLLTQQRRPHLEATVQLLLRRGANPNASCLPMPVLFFAVKAADTAAVKLLLKKGADANARLSIEKLGITPIHIAVSLPSDAVSITKLLLEAGANPNLRDFAFGGVADGRSPLHTACCREDNDEDANSVISLLLDHSADPNLLCNGHSALSLAIGSGNDLAVDTLLKRDADPSLFLTHGVGSPLCAAVSFTAEKRRKIVDRIRLVNKLIRSGANILAPIVVSNEHPPGTVVDYAYNVFHQDRRIAHTPYHALTPYEREIYIARRKMLDYLAELLRTHVLKKEKKLLEEQLARAKALQSESCEEINQENLDRAVSFYFDEQNETSVKELDSSFEKVSIYDETLSCYSSSDSRFPDCGLRVAVIQTPSDHMNVSRLSINSTKKRQLLRKNRFRYCYECGRSVAVRLAACTRCKEVFYCSRNCKLKAWNSRHKEECIRISAPI